MYQGKNRQNSSQNKPCDNAHNKSSFDDAFTAAAGAAVAAARSNIFNIDF